MYRLIFISILLLILASCGGDVDTVNGTDTPDDIVIEGDNQANNEGSEGENDEPTEEPAPETPTSHTPEPEDTAPEEDISDTNDTNDDTTPPIIISEPATPSDDEQEPSTPDLHNDCLAPAGLTLTDISSVVDWINEMPKPLSLPCFIKSIPRPLFFNATDSTISAQPAISKESPRVFFLMDKLTLSIVMDERVENGEDADGVQLLELGEQVEGYRSIKAEIKFPIMDSISQSTPFQKLELFDFNDVSICAVCHDDEILENTIEGIPVFSSEMIRSVPSSEVSEFYLLNQYALCVEEQEPYRCEIFDAVFAQGEMIWRSFPKDMPTIFD